MANIAFEFGIPAGADGTNGTNGADGATAYAQWIEYAESEDPPIAQPSGTIKDMFDWLAAQAQQDITASATVSSLPSGSTPTVTVTVT